MDSQEPCVQSEWTEREFLNEALLPPHCHWLPMASSVANAWDRTIHPKCFLHVLGLRHNICKAFLTSCIVQQLNSWSYQLLLPINHNTNTEAQWLWVSLSLFGLLANSFMQNVIHYFLMRWHLFLLLWSRVEKYAHCALLWLHILQHHLCIYCIVPPMQYWGINVN